MKGDMSTDKEHLQFIYDRLRHHHGESDHNDYMIRLKSVIDNFDAGYLHLWKEGFRATGESSTARFIGTFKCATLREAVERYRSTLLPYQQRDIDIDNLTEWGCRFFDNEKDAREGFG